MCAAELKRELSPDCHKGVLQEGFFFLIVELFSNSANDHHFCCQPTCVDIPLSTDFRSRVGSEIEFHGSSPVRCAWGQGEVPSRLCLTPLHLPPRGTRLPLPVSEYCPQKDKRVNVHPGIFRREEGKSSFKVILHYRQWKKYN